MLIFIVGITQAEAFVLHLAPPTPSKREKRRITTNPLITTRCFDQRCFGIATEAAMLAGYRLGFHAVVGHDLSCLRCMSRQRARAAPHRGSLYPYLIMSIPASSPSMVARHGGL